MINLSRLRAGAVASGFTIAAAISMLLITRTAVIAFSTERPLYVITGVILLVAAIGPLVEMFDTIGQILLWNGVGWSAGLVIFGLESVGSMPIWPLMLATIALTFWPRVPDKPVPIAAVSIALVGGFAVCWLGWLDIELPIPEEWLEVQ